MWFTFYRGQFLLRNLGELPFAHPIPVEKNLLGPRALAVHIEFPDSILQLNV